MARKLNPYPTWASCKSTRWTIPLWIPCLYTHLYQRPHRQQQMKRVATTLRALQDGPSLSRPNYGGSLLASAFSCTLSPRPSSPVPSFFRLHSTAPVHGAKSATLQLAFYLPADLSKRSEGGKDLDGTLMTHAGQQRWFVKFRCCCRRNILPCASILSQLRSKTACAHCSIFPATPRTWV